MKSSLYTRFSDAFSDLSLDENKPKPIVTFKEPITTSLIMGLVEEINFEEEVENIQDDNKQSISK